jgi:hypothetical protein
MSTLPIAPPIEILHRWFPTVRLGALAGPKAMRATQVHIISFLLIHLQIAKTSVTHPNSTFCHAIVSLLGLWI